ncbi:MAG TPA: hypothetical protein VF054_06625 [Micromonosporaceae bacterium]
MGVYYLGRPGALSSFAYPLRGYEPGVEDFGATVHKLIGGGAAVDQGIRPTRTWKFSWSYLTLTERSYLRALFLGHLGPPPFTLIDPNCDNYLTRNQASGGNALGNTTGFAVLAGTESLSTSTSVVYQGTTSIKHSLPATVTQGILRLVASSSADRSYIAWPQPEQVTFWARLHGQTTLRARVAIQFLDVNAAVLSTATSTYTALSTSAWSRFTVTATPPAGTVYIEPRVQVDPTSVSTATAMYLGGARLDIGGDDATDAPGDGVPLVAIVDMASKVQFAGYRDMEATLVDVSDLV